MKIVNKAYLFFVLSYLFTACTSTSKETISGKDIAVSFEVLENNNKNQVNFQSQFVVKNNGKVALGNKGWDIYFNFARKIFSDSITDPVSVTHVNGDLYRISPLDNFSLKNGDSINIEFLSNDWIINYSNAPAGFYITFTDTITGKEETPEILDYDVRPFVRETQYKRFNDHTPLITPQYIYNKNQNITLLPKDKLIPVIPSPVSYTYGAGIVILDPTFTIVADPILAAEKKYLASELNRLLDQSLATSGQKVIELKIGSILFKNKSLKNGDEAYQLDIKADKITILGTDADGIFYGIQSLKSLLPSEAFKGKHKSLELREISITDFPRYKYRGLCVDAARNFKSKENILKIIDIMSFYKLNKFHFHLTDDEGWRLEIKSLPELAEIGSKRVHSKDKNAVLPSFGSGPFGDSKVSYGSGYYTREDFIEILKYATERHIEVIPEIDLPGHSRAAIKSMIARYDRLMQEGKKSQAKEFLLNDPEDKSEYRSVQGWNDNVVCVCQNSTYNFIETVLKDVMSMYKDAGATLTTVHTGGDEVPEGVWEKSPQCNKLIQADAALDSTDQLAYYFLNRMNQMLSKYNLATAGWEEIGLKKERVKGVMVHRANPEFLNSNFRPYIWNNVWGWGTEDHAYKLANAGYKIVMTNVTNLYFDLAYDKSPEEPGSYWGGFVDTRKPFEFVPDNIYLSANEDRMGNAIDKSIFKEKERLTAKGKFNILGMQGNLWSENAKGNSLTEYFIFPKLLGLAERAWSQDPIWATVIDDKKRNLMLNVDWNIFANTLGQKELPRLDYMDGGVNYRISTPGGMLENGMLNVNIEYPGLTVHYTTDGTEPTASSPVYKEPVKVNGVVKLKAFNTTGRSGRTVVVK